MHRCVQSAAAQRKLQDAAAPRQADGEVERLRFGLQEALQTGEEWRLAHSAAQEAARQAEAAFEDLQRQSEGERLANESGWLS